MQWIKTGKQLGQAVKNVQRLRHIVAVLSRHGFVDIVERMNLGKFLPNKLKRLAESGKDKEIPERLREAFEELGPTFVKLGQLLSTRPDLLPENFISEFTKLQDKVQTITFEEVKKVVEQELGKPLSENFQTFDEKPLASASISQVHTATLFSGEKVIVKVQRPGIQKIVQNDISILTVIANLLEDVPEAKIANPTILVDEFFRTLTLELDFLIEANNIAKMSQNMKDIPEIVLPKVYKRLSTQKVIVQEKLEGIRVNDKKALEAAGINKKKVVQIGAKAFFQSVMIDGLFHGDMHGGNLFILPGNKLGIIDFGQVGRLSQKSRDQLANMVFALLSEDFENLCYQYAELGAADPSIDFDGFQRELRNALSPYMGLNLNEVNTGRVLIEATKVASKYQIKVPGEWMIVFKAILTMESMGRSLDPEFDMLATGQELVKDLVKNQYSVQRISKDALFVVKDLVSLLQVLPRQIRWMFKKFNRNDFAFEIKSPDLVEIRKQLDTNSKRTSLSVIIAGLLIAGSIALQFTNGREIFGYPAAAFVMTLFALLFLLRLLSI